MRERGTPTAPVRCAVYTRKSTEEGLDQDFNSLDAQREACGAYILSQRHEGWVAVPDIYDDGGYSGGTMERPALKALLADIERGKVDVIVVYKVDRLTRSLADFAKIVEVLDARGASFVSVTQSFNTTSSMGRLTLNVLLSFAQFEREVTSERIRDKIAASKAKGMWMGGPPPLGYDVVERKLVVNEIEAATVRHIFERYLKLGSGRNLVAELERVGIRSKRRLSKSGEHQGARPISRGALYAMLQNRLYAGEIVHKGARYPGQHEAIIDPALFEQVQTLLAAQRECHRRRENAQERSLLAGKLWDHHGRRMSPSHAAKGSRRYRYYVSQNDGEASKEPVLRVSAPDLENRLIELLFDMIARRREEIVGDGQLTGRAIERLNASVDAGLYTDEGRKAWIETGVSRVEISCKAMTLTVSLAAIDPALAETQPTSISVPISGVRSGKQTKLVIAPTGGPSPSANPSLVKLVVHALALRDRISDQSADCFDELASALGYSREYAADLLRVSFLSPHILTAIIDGRHPAELTRTKLIKAPKLPLDWPGQRLALGFEANSTRN